MSFFYILIVLSVIVELAVFYVPTHEIKQIKYNFL